MTPSGLLLAALSVALFPHATRAACYKIDGSPADDDSHQPCDPDAEVSACCAINKSKPDICLSSGLCYAQDNGYQGLIYSNGCTDKSGLAAECPHVCPDRTNDWDGGSEVATWNVLQCGKGNSFCCRSAKDSKNCCDDAIQIDVGTLLLPTKTATVSGTVSTSASPTADATASESAAATGKEESPSTESGSSECPKDNTAVVGGAVGGALGAALLASLGVIAVMWKRRSPGQAVGELPSGHGQWAGGVPPDSKGYYGHAHANTHPVTELEAKATRSELTG